MLNNTLLLDMQLTAPLQANKDYVGERVGDVIKFLDDYTLDAAETEILNIIGDLTPEEFYLFIKLLSRRTYQTRELLNRYDVNEKDELYYSGVKDSSRSYLQKLYDDLNGTEFTTFNQIMKSKLLAYKAGSISRMEEILDKISRGKFVREFHHYETYIPFKLTRFDSWADGNQPGFCRFQPGGDLIISWEKRMHWYTVNGHTTYAFKMTPTDLIVVEHAEIPGKYKLTTALEIKNMIDKGDRGTLFNALNIIGIACGGFAVGVAKGLLKKALVALFQVILPSAGQYVEDHEAHILKMQHGAKVVNGFRLFAMVSAAYGISRIVLSPIGAAVVGKMRQSVDDFVNANTVDDVVTGVAAELVKIEQGMDDIMSRIHQLGIRSGEKGWFERFSSKPNQGGNNNRNIPVERTKIGKLTFAEEEAASTLNGALPAFDKMIRDTKMFREHIKEVLSGVFYRGIGPKEIQRIKQQSGMIPRCFTSERNNHTFGVALSIKGADDMMLRHTGGTTPYFTGMTTNMEVAGYYALNGIITRITIPDNRVYMSHKFSRFNEFEYLVPGKIDISLIERYVPETGQWEPLIDFISRL